MQRLPGGLYEVNLHITASFAPGDGLSFVVTAHGASATDAKGTACLEAGRETNIEHM